MFEEFKLLERHWWYNHNSHLPRSDLILRVVKINALRERNEVKDCDACAAVNAEVVDEAAAGEEKLEPLGK